MNEIYTEHVVRAVDSLRDRRCDLARELQRIYAAWHREMSCERTRTALAVKRVRGEAVGTAPLGTRKGADGHIERNPAEEQAVRYIVSLRGQGLSVRAIAERLNREGVPSRGTAWHRQTVWRVLQRRGGVA